MNSVPYRKSPLQCLLTLLQHFRESRLHPENHGLLGGRGGDSSGTVDGGVGESPVAWPPLPLLAWRLPPPFACPPFALPPRCPNPGPNCVPHCSKSPRDQNLLTPFQKGKKICLSKLPNEENYLSICLILQLRSANLGLRAVA